MAPRAPFALPRQITSGPASGGLDGEPAAAPRLRRDDGRPVSLLASIETRGTRAPIFRLASDRSVEDFIGEEEYDSTSAAELMELVKPTATRDLERALLDAPFKPRPRLARAGSSTRFSDGSFSVFYGALEADTADAEIRYWHPKKSTRPRTAHYIRFVCDFSGQTKDLTPMRAKWPQLTHDSDYRFCNALGAEAVESDLDGLLAPSARKDTGTNLPVFQRRAIDSPVVQARVAVTLDPSTGDVSTRESPVEVRV